MSDYKKLIFDRQDAVTTITLNRPEVHNALDRELSAELKEAILAVRADRECRVLILRGAGETRRLACPAQVFRSYESLLIQASFGASSTVSLNRNRIIIKPRQLWTRTFSAMKFPPLLSVASRAP